MPFTIELSSYSLRAMFRLVIPLALALLLTAIPAGATSHLSGRHVCLDPGHGGSDPGAVYAGMREADLALDIAQRLATMLVADGATVTLTRTTADVSLGNSARADICNAAGAQVLLSIHLNASRDTSVDYFRAFYGKRIKDLDFARVLDRSYLLQNATYTGLLPHASVTNFANGTLLHFRGPAALAETVFLSNPDEQRLLAAGTRQGEIATELYRGLAAWFSTP